MAVNHPLIVLDANILIRAVLGQRVRFLVERYAEKVRLIVPSPCVDDARRYLPTLLEKRGINPAEGFTVLNALIDLMHVATLDEYKAEQPESLARLADRDPNDWEVLSTALIWDAPLWTEDQDFFGIGIATWMTRHVERYLSPSP